MARTLCLTILPNVETLIHKTVRNYEFTNYMIERTKVKGKKDDFVIPFIENLDGKTALHLCLDEKT